MSATSQSAVIKKSHVRRVEFSNESRRQQQRDNRRLNQDIDKLAFETKLKLRDFRQEVRNVKAMQAQIRKLPKAHDDEHYLKERRHSLRFKKMTESELSNDSEQKHSEQSESLAATGHKLRTNQGPKPK